MFSHQFISCVEQEQEETNTRKCLVAQWQRLSPIRFAQPGLVPILLFDTNFVERTSESTCRCFPSESSSATGQEVIGYLSMKGTCPLQENANVLFYFTICWKLPC